ncbi:hypothetical protein KP509_1Z045300 [Ceratopteris richardii]|nr:hypothetical protein KP509_1Z045300 [Ceratopteris richardii]
MSRMALKLSCACASLSHLRASVALSPINCLKISSTDRASTISCHIPSLSLQRPGPSWRSSFALCRAASNTTLAAENECERLIQHLLVPEEKLSLVIELQRQAQQGRLVLIVYFVLVHL